MDDPLSALHRACEALTSAVSELDANPGDADIADRVTRARLGLYFWFVQRGWSPPEGEVDQILRDFELLHQGTGAVEREISG